MDIEITEAQPDRPANDSGANDPAPLRKCRRPTTPR